MNEPLPADGWFSYFVAALIGLLFGSFLNVCIYRIPRDLSVVHPRSTCVTCGNQLRWFDNIPVLSFLLLRGRCRDCMERISPRYPLVEVLTAVVFCLLVARYGWTAQTLRWLILDILLIVLLFTDAEVRILPDELTWGGLATGLLLAWMIPMPGLTSIGTLIESVEGAVAAAVPLWLAGMLYKAIRKRQGLGFGDIKLLALLGAFLGVRGSLAVLFFASLAGALAGLVLVALHGKKAALWELPFGSFLCGVGLLIPLINSGSTSFIAVP